MKVLISILEYSVFIGLGFFVCTVSHMQTKDVDPCERAKADIKAMQACLSNRPQCVIGDGPDAFKYYHASVDFYEENCAL